MKTRNNRFLTKKTYRRGAVTPLIAMLLVAILSIGAFAISISQIQLARTQAQAVADCASLSATAILGERSPDVNETWDELGQLIAQNNTILGRAAVISRDNIQIGNAGTDVNGRMVFHQGARPRNAIKVNVQLGNDTAMGSVPLAFPFLFDVDTFSVRASSVTAKTGHDICLCIDRSQSMNEKREGGYPTPYYNDRPGTSKSAKFYPHPTESRWAGLLSAIPAILDAFKQTEIEEYASLITFGSARQWDDGDLSTYYEGATIDIQQTRDYDSIYEELQHMWDQRPMISGQTWIHQGIYSSLQVLDDPNREFARKTIVLLTDGEQWPRNTLHYDAAQVAADAGVTIHTICYTAGSRGQQEMQDIASIGGGRYFFAANPQELQQVFAQIGQLNPLNIVE